MVSSTGSAAGSASCTCAVVASCAVCCAESDVFEPHPVIKIVLKAITAAKPLIIFFIVILLNLQLFIMHFHL
jgi:hypothetical protein